MNVFLMEPFHPTDWGDYNQYHGMLKIGAWHKKQGDNVRYITGDKAMPSVTTAEYPDIIYIASLLSYWEPHYIKTIWACKSKYNRAKIVFGGIYAINAEPRVKLWEEQFGITVRPRFEEAMNEVPDVTLNGSKLASLLTSRGCPNACSYCSVPKVYGAGWKPRPLNDVMGEIIVQHARGVEEICLYDDNFLFQADHHAKPLLESIIRIRENSKYRSLKFAIPSGFQASHMTPELARLMKQANFTGRISTSIESVSPDVLKMMGRTQISKNEYLEQCVRYMVEAGYKARKINVYFLCGLPYQNIDDMLQTAIFIGSLGCCACMQRFAPIPGTKDFDRCGLDMMTYNMALTEGDKFVSPGASFTDRDLRELSRFCYWQNCHITYSQVNMYRPDTDIVKKGLRMAFDAVKM